MTQFLKRSKNSIQVWFGKVNTVHVFRENQILSDLLIGRQTALTSMKTVLVVAMVTITIQHGTKLLFNLQWQN